MAKTQSILTKAKTLLVWAKRLNTEPEVLDIDRPKDSIQAFDLNFVDPEVGVSVSQFKVVIENLTPGAEYEYILTSFTFGVEGKQWDSLPMTLRVPTETVYNGDFEKGFFGGIAEGWKTTGRAFLTQASVYPFQTKPLSGKDSQVIFARGRKGMNLETTMGAPVVIPKTGTSVDVGVLTRGMIVEGDSNAKIFVRLGMASGGDANPKAENVRWGRFQTVDSEKDSFPVSESLSLEGLQIPAVVTIFIHCKTDGDLGGATAALVLDDVTVSVK